MFVLELYLWRLTGDKKLVSKAFGHKWKFGEIRWNTSKNIFENEDTKEVLGVKEGKSLIGNLVDLQTKYSFPNQAWEIVKSTDKKEADEGWIKIKHKKSGCILEVSESGDELSIQGNKEWNM